jgi:hypothetical protein
MRTHVRELRAFETTSESVNRFGPAQITFNSRLPWAWRELPPAKSIVFRRVSTVIYSDAPLLRVTFGMENARFTVSTNPSKLDGLVTYSWAPSCSDLFSSKSRRDELNIITGIDRNDSSLLSSAKTSIPLRFGRLRSKRIKSGRGAWAKESFLRTNASACSPSIARWSSIPAWTSSSVSCIAKKAASSSSTYKSTRSGMHSAV